jgi:hypothetical protein
MTSSHWFPAPLLALPLLLAAGQQKSEQKAADQAAANVVEP